MKKNFVYDFKLPRYIIKIIHVILLIFVVILLSSCFTIDSAKGIDYFLEHEYIGDFEISKLVYDDNFIKKYTYIKGDFYYSYTSYFDFKSSYREKALLYLQYDDEKYNLAKDDILSNTDYSADVHFTCYGFEFYENLKCKKQHELDSSFPNWFTMIAYNYNINILLFFGFYGPGSYSKNKKLHIENNEDFSCFLVDQYSEYYQFEN